MLPNMRWGLFLQQHQFHQENAKSDVDLSNQIIVEHLTTWIHQKFKAPLSSVLIFDIQLTNSKLFPPEDESFDSSAFLCHLAICPTAQPPPHFLNHSSCCEKSPMAENSEWGEVLQVGVLIATRLKSIFCRTATTDFPSDYVKVNYNQTTTLSLIASCDW